MERSVWFCTNPDECSWERLGALAGLDPADYQWWAQDVQGRRALEAKPRLGKRYTLPNRVYVAMGDASFYNPFTEVPYLGYAYQWLLDYVQSSWSFATRPVGAAIVFRKKKPLEEGYHVTTIRNLSNRRLAEILASPNTYGLVYHGHGNKYGLGTYNIVHGQLAPVVSIREVQHHLLGRAVLNSCVSRQAAVQITSPTGVARGHAGKYSPPLGILQW